MESRPPPRPLGSVHQPQTVHPVTMPPQNVGLAVAVVVARRRPSVLTDFGELAPAVRGSFINHRALVPELFRHKNVGAASPL